LDTDIKYLDKLVVIGEISLKWFDTAG